MRNEESNDIPSNHKLAVLLTVVSTKLDDVLKNQEDDKTARAAHETNDSARFVAVHKKIDAVDLRVNSVHKYAAIAISFGVFIGYFGKELKQAIFGA